MGADRLRVLGLALASLGLVIATTTMLDWFVLVVLGRDIAAIDLSTQRCLAADFCGEESVALGKNLYGAMSTITLWASLAFALIVALQCGARVVIEQASPTLTRLGYTLASVTIVVAVLTAFFFHPEIPFDIGISIDRTWAPALLLLGLVLGMLALHYSTDSATSESIAGPPPLREPTIPIARVVPARRPTSEPLLTLEPGRPRVKSDPMPSLQSERARLGSDRMPKLESERMLGVDSMTKLESERRLKPATIPPPGVIAAGRTRTRSRPPTLAPPDGMRGKLGFATASAEITRGGLDARREDGKTVLVMWRDVVGVVARRLPATLEGATFVDVVSTAGSTLRVLPWTRLTGEPVAGEGADRAHAFLELVAARCPNVQIDRATREFVEHRAPAAQLPDAETLAAHDARLA